ncbi:MAG: hypothetical protein ACYC6Y_27170 [Thermoguttaceae bacterium]
MCALAPFTSLAFSQDGNLVVRGFGTAEAAGADAIGIVGPSRAECGRPLVFHLAGTPPLDLGRPLLDQLDWLLGTGRLYVYLQKPGLAMTALDVEGAIVFGPAGATLRPQIAFVPDQPGLYRLLVDWNFRQDQLVEHLLAVDAREAPDPPDPSPAPGLLSVLLAYEAGDLPSLESRQADLLTDPRVRAYLDSHCVVEDGQPAWRFLDLSDDDGSRMPPRWQTVIARARGKATPWLIVDNGSATFDGPCPRDADQLLATLKRYGGE